jgi:drug/metabolite transporter (DMT)-like permease
MDVLTTAISLLGTALGVGSRVPQIVRVHQRGSARALAMTVTANCCFAVYSLYNEQWPVLANNVAVISLDSTLLAMRHHYAGMKKSASGSDLVLIGAEAGVA